MTTKKIYLIDGNSFIYRMFFGLPEFSTKNGEVVNAIFGMAKFFVKQLVREAPDYLIFITDAPGKNFRNDLFEDYKATRDRMPDNLKSQIKGIHDIITKMGIDIISIPGYEADDVIGTLANKLTQPHPNPLLPKERGQKVEYEVDILSGDKDLYALISENVKVYDTMKQKKFGIEETKEKFGVYPEKVIDYLAIVGDKADNIPGIDGFGPKKAVDLLNILGGLEEIYKHSDLVLEEKKKFSDFEKPIQSCFKGKTFEKLVASRENAFLSQKLATIDLNVDLPDFNLENFLFKKDELITPEVKQDFIKYEFFSLLGEGEQKKIQTWKDLNLKVKIIGDDEGLDELGEKITHPPLGTSLNNKERAEIVLDTETTSLAIMQAELVGISIYIDDSNIYYINRLHNGPQVSDHKIADFLENILHSDILIIGHNLKYDLEIMELFLHNYKKTSGNVQEVRKSDTIQMSFGV